jgi:DNA modification methylase
MSTIKLILGDCLQEMKKIPDKSIDLVLTDPPYGVDFKYEGFVDTPGNLKLLIDKFIPECLRISGLVAVMCGVKNILLKK